MTAYRRFRWRHVLQNWAQNGEFDLSGAITDLAGVFAHKPWSSMNERPAG